MDPTQQHVFDLCAQGHNVFFTGMGGTGKTYLLLQIADRMRAMHGADKVAITAPTGVAAILCQGQTLHSLAGCGVPMHADDFKKCWRDSAQWRRLKVLIMDEVSMVQPAFLDWLDATVRAIRKVPDRPFGGIQLIACGDFGQLPACITNGVSVRGRTRRRKADPQEEEEESGDDEGPRRQIPINIEECKGAYAFQTTCWREAGFHYVELTHVYRQSDERMVRILTKMRQGIVDQDVRDFMAECEARALDDTEEGIRPTVLYARNKDVDAENLRNLNELDKDTEKIYLSKDSVEPLRPMFEPNLRADPFFSQNNLTPYRIVLRVGAQVMCTKNLPHHGLVNGSRGVVVATDKPFPEVRFCNGKTLLCKPEAFEKDVYGLGKCQRRQIPLRLAWAITVHKSQVG